MGASCRYWDQVWPVQWLRALHVSPCAFGPFLGGRQGLVCTFRGKTSKLSNVLSLMGSMCVARAAGHTSGQSHVLCVPMPSPVPATVGSY